LVCAGCLLPDAVETMVSHVLNDEFTETETATITTLLFNTSQSEARQFRSPLGYIPFNAGV
jgi:hypothetical protein